MIRFYNTDIDIKKTMECTDIEEGCWINMVSPTEEEIVGICRKLKINEDLIRDSLDEEEKARIEIDEDEGIRGYIIDVTTIEKDGKDELYSTIPLGVIIINNKYLLTVALKELKVIKDLEINLNRINTTRKNKMILQIFYKTTTEYLRVLADINREKNLTEKTLKNSMRNKELLNMLSLEKSLVYITTSLRSNEVVFERTLRGSVITLNDDEQEILEDVIIENRQAIEMAKIYSNTLNGTMDAYASIISNNLNIVMKVLTSITIIMSIPTILASFWGMNVPVPFTKNPFGFFIVVIISAVISVGTFLWFKKRDMLN